MSGVTVYVWGHLGKALFTLTVPLSAIQEEQRVKRASNSELNFSYIEAHSAGGIITTPSLFMLQKAV